MKKPLPADVKRTLGTFVHFIKAIYPDATDIEFINAVSSTSQYRKMVQFTAGSFKGLAIIGAFTKNEGVRIEYPYNPVLWSYNS